MRLAGVTALAAFWVFGFGATSARAQVRESDFRLALEVGIVDWTSEREKGEVPLGDYEQRRNTLGAGPSAGAGSAGVILGYAASRRFVPSVYFGIEHEKLEVETERATVRVQGHAQARSFELRPFLEITLIPESRFVPYVLLGFSVRRRVIDPDGEAESSRLAYGPVVGVGAHGFVVARASFDFALLFRGGFVNDEDRETVLERSGVEDVKQRELALTFCLGTSFWL